ncbi:MAG: L-serine ammonia-lyase [Gammaproteobacteria bacterium]
MKVSIFDLFSIGVGPSSSHTVGPMRAAYRFLEQLDERRELNRVDRVCVDLYGSLALTGRGHATDKAVLLGLLGFLPDTVDPDQIETLVKTIHDNKKLKLYDQHTIPFDPSQDLIFNYDKQLDYHTNALTIKAADANHQLINQETYYSVGGGFVVSQTQIDHNQLESSNKAVPYNYQSAKELLDFCERDHKSIAEIVYANEKTWRTDDEIQEGLLKIWQAMKACVERGLAQKGILPGGLNVRRRAATIAENLMKRNIAGAFKQSINMEWLNVYAMAVNEENAAGGRMVTAPTNGAAGILPAVLYYQQKFQENASIEDVKTYLLTAGGIGILYKEQASISGAEVGCQGEVGVACSMAAGGLTAVLGGNIFQVENAAEVGMEHHLGLTCDPINGLVQIPCIERNAMAAVRAVNCAQLSLLEDGQHIVSLDKVIATMKQTGKDMLTIYKETSQGGLAVNHPEC